MLRENWNDAGPGFHPVSSSDYLPAAQLRDLQLRRLQSMVGRAYAHVPLFRGRMDARGLTPESSRSELRSHDPTGEHPPGVGRGDGRDGQ